MTPLTSMPGDPAEAGGEGRVGTLRGASVQFDSHRLVQIAVGLVLGALVVLVVLMTVIGIHTNQQIDRLHNDGVPVTVTVTGCLGQLGGSGSNTASYSCNGSYVLDGHRYVESLPGTALHAPGTKLAAVAVPGDPALVSPVSVESNQRASNGVFLVPLVLFVILIVLVTALALRQRSRRSRGTAQHASVAD